MRHALVVAGVLAACLGWAGGEAHAQAPELHAAPGDRVRVTWCEGVRERCEVRRADGTLIASDTAAIRLDAARGPMEIRWRSVSRVDTYRGSRSALRTVLLGAGGFVVGGIAGILIGSALQGDCYEFDCLAGPFYGLVLGAPLGLITGISVGIGTRERWVTSYDAFVLGGVPAGPVGVGLAVAVAVPFGR